MLNYISNKEEGNKDNRDAIETVLGVDNGIDNSIDNSIDSKRTISNYTTLYPPTLILRRN